MSVPYPPPVNRLLSLGREPALRRTWPDYRHLGLEARHVPALVRMATDPALYAAPEKVPDVWASVHAWRALGQLEASAAAAPLLALLEREMDNPWVTDEVPLALGMIGPAALPGATLLLFDEDRDDRLRFVAARVITEVGTSIPTGATRPPPSW
jgi:HEAT repeat protein